MRDDGGFGQYTVEGEIAQLGTFLHAAMENSRTRRVQSRMLAGLLFIFVGIPLGVTAWSLLQKVVEVKQALNLTLPSQGRTRWATMCR